MRTKKTLTATAAAALCLATTPSIAGGRPDLVLAALESGRAHVPDELLVQYKAGASRADFRAVRAKSRATDLETLRADRIGRLMRMKLRGGESIANAIRRLERDPAVEFAETNWIYTHDAASNDPHYADGSLWGMQGAATSPANIYGSGAADAWAEDKQDCGDVWVGIIDEGYMYAHADLAANAGRNPAEDGGVAGVDDDGNGRIDDTYGWDFAGNNKTVFDGVMDDHGTHVAGAIGAVGGNGTGVAGVCWSVKLISAKFLGAFGGATANAVKAIDYLTDLKTRHSLNLVATNNSWGGGYSQALRNAIARAGNADILFIAAAGDPAADCDVSRCYPADYPEPNVISVASITSIGGLSSFSNFGAATVHLGAPGSAIWSTVPKRQGLFQIVSGYANYSGASMATPHVTGAAALYKARNPNASAADVTAAILNSAVPTPSLAGVTITGGRLGVSGI
ncbi:MAG: S8 family serine peptidase [Parvularculaceae bacterium]|nr:S8 family serine peptidase [Parvularculaceae bacterium]